MNRKKIVQAILRYKLVAIVRLQHQKHVADVLEGLVAGGVQILEITSNTPGFTKEIEIARNRYPEILIGAGTVTNNELAIKAIKAGAQFLVTPNTDPEIVLTAHNHDIPVIMGALTPTEISAAVEAGADIVKLFPAATLGLEYFKAIKAPFDQAYFFAVGGIGLENVKDWMDAGAAGVGIGGALAKPISNDVDREQCIRTAKEFIKCTENK